jgi:glycerate-2-kinase
MSNTTQRLTEIEAQEKALADEKAKLLAASKDADLEMVKKLCKQHGFTATQLRSSLKSKSKTKAKGDRAATKKTAAKKAPVKK